MADEPAGNTFVARPIQTTGAAQQIADQLRKGILLGQLSPGQRLPSEAELAAQYSVSRGTIRETMKLLSAAQLVESTRGASGGTFVRIPEPGTAAATMGDAISLWFNAGSTSLAEVNDAREWIERGCVRMAATNRRESDLDGIRVAVEAMEAPGLEIDDMLELDIDFHQAVSRAARNAVLELAMNAIHIVRPYTNTMLVAHLEIARIAAQHREIYEGIALGDVVAAEAAFDRHMAHLREVREKALADQRPEDVPIAALRNEAHPQIERVRARVLGR